MPTFLATGHPPIPTGDFDFTPLLYIGLLLLTVYRARFPFRLWMLPVSVVAGGAIDSISDALGFSMVTTTCILALVALLFPIRKRWAHPLPPPEV